MRWICAQSHAVTDLCSASRIAHMMNDHRRAVCSCRLVVAIRISRPGEPMTSVDEWIARHVSSLSFADVGGLWNTKNERISAAFKAGATRLAMIDVQPLGSHWWNKFHERCR